MPCCAHAVPYHGMLHPCRPLPCHAAPMPSPTLPCHDPANLGQCRVLRESPRGSQKYPNCWFYSSKEWYTSDNNLHGTPRGSQKKLNAGRTPTCHLWKANANSHMPCHAMPLHMPCCATALRTRFQNSMVVAWHV
jgi:hypothetical protein